MLSMRVRTCFRIFLLIYMLVSNASLSLPYRIHFLLSIHQLVMEEAVITGERLEKELLATKNDSAKNNEDSKSIRKRLAGCHLHYKHLQEQHDKLLEEKDAVDRQSAKAQSNVALRIAQIESCTPASETTEDEDEDYYYYVEDEVENEDKTDEDSMAGDNRTEEEEDYYYYEVIEEDEGETGEDDTTTITTGTETPTDLASSLELSAETDGDTVTATSDYQVEILSKDWPPQVEILSRENQQL